MVSYEVTLEVEPGRLAALEAYMRKKHVPEILATKCFRHIRLDRDSGNRLRTSYQAVSPEALRDYLDHHASHFRADFQAHFPVGVTVSREIWEELKAWP